MLGVLEYGFFFGVVDVVCCGIEFRDVGRG